LHFTMTIHMLVSAPDSTANNLRYLKQYTSSNTIQYTFMFQSTSSLNPNRTIISFEAWLFQICNVSKATETETLIYKWAQIILLPALQPVQHQSTNLLRLAHGQSLVGTLSLADWPKDLVTHFA